MRLLRLLFYFCNTLHHLLKNHPAHGRFRRARNEATRHAEEPVGQAGDQLMATGAHRIHDASGQNLRRHAAFFFCIVRAIAAGVLGAGGLLPGVFQELAAMHPIGRIAQPEEIAHIAIFLCSEKAKFITGACLSIDGGIGCRLHDPA
jgi:hypothetical protein